MPDAPSRIAVTGAAGFLGKALVDSLAARPNVDCVLAIDRLPNPRIASLPPNVRWVVQDVRQSLDDVFVEHRIQAVAHLAYVLRPSHNREFVRAINVGGTASLIRACDAAGTNVIVYPSSTTVYGAHATYQRPYVETDPVNPVRGFQYSEDKVEAERLILAFGQKPGARVAVLRGPPVMGPSADNFIVRSLTARWLPSPLGANVEFQFLHIDDLVSAIVLMLTENVNGVYNISGGGSVRWRDMVGAFGNRVVPVPGPVLKAVVGATWTLRLQSESPACGVEFIRHPWLADVSKAARDLDWLPRYSSEQALFAARPAIGIPQ
ncbi:MAG: NAD-dependent epimerase/dehydratase family protein [Chloroflexi bacterium]|nr:NAD-dependent epimerase/dehydratase family protein [Chloroflexota bacterium]